MPCLREKLFLPIKNQVSDAILNGGLSEFFLLYYIALFGQARDMKIDKTEAFGLLEAGEKPFLTLLRHGTLQVELYRPQKVDLQKPHIQDEVYVIISGNGQFFRDGEYTSFMPGDVLFVPAGIEHRFEKFSEDFATWVIFYGPDGGESQ
jgi:mannose-6-phosphate isomerase-like protein (cupin superfamily)